MNIKAQSPNLNIKRDHIAVPGSTTNNLEVAKESHQDDTVVLGERESEFIDFGKLPKAIGTGGKVLLGVLAVGAVGSVVAGGATHTIQPGNVGVKFGPGGLSEEVLEPGLVFHTPFVSGVREWSVRPDNYFANETDIVTADKFAIKVDAQVPYSWIREEVPGLLEQYGTPENFKEEFVKPNFRAAMRTVMPNYTLSQLEGTGQTADGRPIRDEIDERVYAAFTQKVEQHIQQNEGLEKVPVRFGPVQLRYARPPHEIAASRLETQKAEEAERTAEARLRAANAEREVEVTRADTAAEVAKREADAANARRLEEARSQAEAVEITAGAEANAARQRALAEAEGIKAINDAQSELSPEALRLRELELFRDAFKDWGEGDGAIIIGGEGQANPFLMLDVGKNATPPTN